MKLRRTALALSIAAALAVPLFAHAEPDQALQVGSRERIDRFPWTKEETQWIRDHVGIIFYDDGETPRYSMSEQIDIAHSLGTRKIKTWLKGQYKGEMLERIQRPLYQRVLSEFDTVLFDVCPDYILGGKYDDEKGRTVRSEYEGVAYYLASKFHDSKKTFMLSLFMETNLFMGSERAHYPDFPADRFFRDAADGVRAGIRRAQAENAVNTVHVYSVIEVANLPKEYIKRYLPKTNADLYAISYYGQGELGAQDITLPDAIKAVSESAPHNGPFGKDNIILGELGRTVSGGGHDGEDLEQIQYLRKTLEEARTNRLQYAFIFWLTDQERSPGDGWGLTSSKRAGGQMRRAWHAFHQIYGGRLPSHRPSHPQVAVDAVRTLDFNPKPGQPVRMEIDLSNRSSLDVEASPVKGVDVGLYAGSQSRKTTVSLAPNEVVTLRATIPAPEDANTTVLVNTPYADAAIVKRFSLDRADLVVDRVYTEPANPKVGDKVMMFAVVRNKGNTAITDFAVHFHVDDFNALWAAWGCIYGDNKLGKDQAQPIGGGFPWIATTPGVHRIRAYANPDGSRESDYSNNYGYAEVTVTP